MAGNYSNESMLDLYIFETSNLLEQLEHSILASEKSNHISKDDVNEIFRIMHTIKGSSAMMLFDNIASLAHSIEDLFYFIRENDPREVDCSALSDIVLEGVDFLKVELEKVKAKDPVDGDAQRLKKTIADFLNKLKLQNFSAEKVSTSRKKTKKNSVEDLKDIPEDIEEITEKIPEEKPRYYIAPNITEPPAALSKKNWYKAVIFYQDGCEMENIRAYTVIHNLKEIADKYIFTPEDIIENDLSAQVIKEQGFTVVLRTDKSYEEMHEFFMQTIFLRELKLEQIEDQEDEPVMNQHENALTPQIPVLQTVEREEKAEKEVSLSSAQQSIISVNVAKLDRLMDLVGEMVIAEAMVTQNPDLKGLQLDNFYKAARQLGKITGELQDMVMAIRMVPLSTTFHKMHRIVRDMSKKLNKEVRLEIIGEETEVDKNIIEHISDPLMHLIRNAIDHGIEAAAERIAAEKSKAGTITLEAKNAGSDVLIIVRDDGKGLNKEKILSRARQNGLLAKSEQEMSDREVFNLIFLPGFSTKENITEFSGRGVGMDVVSKNIQTVGGSVSVDSVEGTGTTITMKIPLTLAIIGGMNIKVGNSRYTIPTVSIRESFRPKESDIIRDPDGNEMIMVRSECYPVIRLHTLYKVKTEVTEFSQGIFIMVEDEEKSCCIFADELLGEQQVVVKALPYYIQNLKKDNELGGCTLLGDGNISLILDIQSITRLVKK
ncbi:MAG: chemotaxis protein CheA [Dehalobacter sp. 4CP]|uniref:chemotaxis protein CheW n=1 Tax=Dehalobacter sp. CP TaxID=2594474 RepID=UPI00031D9432|nr:chemotaxis protein CheA [Dehalobacter sp. 4CP]